jgi:hypothetical protein
MRWVMRTGHVVAMIVAFTGTNCATAAPTTADGMDAVRAGQWGGVHLAMTIASDRADLEFDCGKASVSGAIDTDRNGAFAVTGSFQPERPGPASREAPPARPMRLSGTVKGDEMQVTVRLTDSNEDVGTFTLTFGAAPRLVKCR